MKYLGDLRLKFGVGFYEKYKKGVSVYCPSCDDSLAFSKNDFREFRKSKYRCTCGDNLELFNAKTKKHLNRSQYYSEVSRTDKGFDINVYSVNANFDIENYYFEEVCFRRRPTVYEDILFKFIFEPGKKVRFISYCKAGFSPYGSVSISPCEKHETKSFPRYLNYCFIDSSLKELDDSIFAPWKDILDTEDIACFIACWNYPSLYKLYRSGFKKIVNNFARQRFYKEYFSTSTSILSINSRCINKIIKCDCNKIKVDREDLTLEDLCKCQKLQAHNIECTSKNIAMCDISFADNPQIFNSKVFKYLRHQIEKHGLFVYCALRDYSDYLDQLKRLRIPFTDDVLFPVDFKKAHGELSERIRLLNLQGKNHLFKDATSDYKRFNIYEKISVEIITDINALIHASSYLHNCSAGYVDKVIDGKCALFLVKTKKKGIDGMLELRISNNNAKVVQLRGLHNNPCSDGIVMFVGAWLEYVNKQLKNAC